MRFVKRVVGRDGRVRLYFQKKRHPRRPLQSPEGSPELEAEVQAILAAESPSKPLPGSLKGAARAYELEDADFKALADSTKVLYRALLCELIDDFGDVAVERFTPAYILDLRNIWAERGHVAANHRLQVLKNVLWPSIVAANRGDPFELVPQARRPAGLKEPNPVWPEHVIVTVLEEAFAQKKFGIARAVALARWSGARRGDLVRLAPRHRQGGRLRWLSGKRRVPVDILEDPELTRWLGRTPERAPADPRQGRKVRPGAPTPLRQPRLVYNVAGDPYTEDGLGLELRKLLVDLAERQKIDGAVLDDAGEIVGSEYGLHGLRHTRGVELALAGCSDAQGAAMMGHKSPASFAQYRRQADKIRLSDDGAAKVAQLRERLANEEVENKMENRWKTEPPPAVSDGG
jgi:integrase